MSEFNAWGRWGQDDERGARNLLDAESVIKAVKSVRSGKVYDLSVPLGRGGRIFPGFHETWRVTTVGAKSDGGSVAGDVVMLHTHAGTHIDALSHFWEGQTIWNGASHSLVNSREGASWAGIDKLDHIIARGVLADVAAHRGVDHLSPGDGIDAEELEECLLSEGVSLDEGSVLLVRTGWHEIFESNRRLWSSGEPGVVAEVAGWLDQRGVVAVGSDSVAVEQVPQHPHANPFHIKALRDYGIYIVENLNLEQLATEKVYEFLFVLAPLPIVGGTGSPVKPLAIG